MELSKQEMELVLLLPELQSKNFFYKMFLTFINESKTSFVNRKWNYPHRKWNYLTQKFFRLNFFWPNILFGSKISDPNLFGPKIFDPKFCSDKKNWSKKFDQKKFWPKILLEAKFLGQKLLDSKIFWPEIFFRLKFDQTFSWGFLCKRKYG